MKSRKVIIVLLLAFMPIFCLLYAQVPFGGLPSINRQSIEQYYYNAEINKSDYREQEKRLLAIGQKISDRQEVLRTEQKKRINTLYGIELVLTIVLFCSGLKSLDSEPSKMTDMSGEYQVGSVRKKYFWRCVCFVCCVGSACSIFYSFVLEHRFEENMSEIFISDSEITKLYAEQEATKEYLLNCKQSIKKTIRPLVEADYQAEVAKQQALRQTEAENLRQFIQKNNVCKKLRIIACSWQKEADIPEHGSLSGDFSSTGGGGGFLGAGGGVGGGMSRGKGKISGEYKGRVYGEEYYFFHFILSDNSYHVINVKECPMWRMAKKGLLVQYKKIYRDYNMYKETITPLWTESYL